MLRFKNFYDVTLSKDQIFKAVTATDVATVDINMVAPYNNYTSVNDYYIAMSAAEGWRPRSNQHGYISNVSIPLAVINALDDPIICEKTLLIPEEIVKVGQGLIIFLLPKRGGHVGFPLGNVASTGWTWMSEVTKAFVHSVKEAQKKVVHT